MYSGSRSSSDMSGLGSTYKGLKPSPNFWTASMKVFGLYL